MSNPNEDALIREVNDEMREERIAQFWQRYGVYVVGAAILLVIAVAGYQGWLKYDTSTRTHEAATFSTATALARAGNLKAATQALEKLESDASSGYRVLAQFEHAAMLAKKGDAKGAAKLYKTIAYDTSSNIALSDLANILGAAVEVNAGNYDRAGLELRLKAIAEDSQPYRFSARELLGLIALEAGDRKTARSIFEKLASSTAAPQGMAQRARDLVQSMNGQ